MNVDDKEGNVEYTPEQLDVSGSVLEAFSAVFVRFQPPPEESSGKENALGKGEVIYSDDDMASEADSEDEKVPRTSRESARCRRRVASSTRTSIGRCTMRVGGTSRSTTSNNRLITNLLYAYLILLLPAK
ncbi:hypothetical protein DFH09DRAFT_1287689 [Mycena vulgaris]|nr:hypothetical protein DFH09DRAFT_1287689 [Mycena vulgaris]